MAAIEDLKNNEFFKGIPDSDIKEILPFCKKKSFDTGINICTHGVRGKEFVLDSNQGAGMIELCLLFRKTVFQRGWQFLLQAIVIVFDVLI